MFNKGRIKEKQWESKNKRRPKEAYFVETPVSCVDTSQIVWTE